MMANYDTREYIYDNSKKSDLEGILVGKGNYYDSDDDDFDKPSQYDIRDTATVCKNPTAKKRISERTSRSI